MGKQPKPQGNQLPPAPGEPYILHGGVIRVSGPFDDDGKAEEGGRRFAESIKAGLKALREHTSEMTADVDIAPGAQVQTFDLFDVATDEHCLIWCVPCLEIVRH